MTAGKDNKPSSNSNKKRQGRKIRFHGRVQFKSIRHFSEFSEEEIRNGWYDKDDFNRMSDNVSEIAKLVGNGETRLNGEELCIRGLEHIVEEELADYRAEKMINSIDAVLDEQEEQWDEGKEEPELIAELYAEYAKPLLREAHLIGLKDAEEGYKSWDDLIQEQEQNKKQTVPRSLNSVVENTEKIETPKTKKKKKKTKKLKCRQKEEKDEDGSSVLSSSLSSLHSLNSSATSFKSLHSVTEEGDAEVHATSMDSLSLNDPSIDSITEKVDTEVDNKWLPLPTKNNTMPLKSKQQKQKLPIQLNTTTAKEDKKNKNNNNDNNKISTPKNKQRKTQPRRSTLDRKCGSELSPFVFRRDGTVVFRKPDVEKLKREQKDKRRTCIQGSLTKFLHNDDDEVDILAGILSK